MEPGFKVDDKDLFRANLKAVEAPEFRDCSRVIDHFLFPVNLPAAGEKVKNISAAQVRDKGFGFTPWPARIFGQSLDPGCQLPRSGDLAEGGKTAMERP